MNNNKINSCEGSHFDQLYYLVVEQSTLVKHHDDDDDDLIIIKNNMKCETSDVAGNLEDITYCAART